MDVRGWKARNTASPAAAHSPSHCVNPAVYAATRYIDETSPLIAKPDSPAPPALRRKP